MLHREFIELCPDPDATIDFRLKSNARNIRRKLSKQHNGDINEMEIVKLNIFPGPIIFAM